MNAAQLQQEQDRFDESVAQIETWWKSPRHQHLKRPYTAISVAALRSTLQREYSSSVQALKLWDLLNKHRAEGTADMTFGTTDPLQAVVMARSLSTVYASGGIAGMNKVQYPGIDHADYPWDTVPQTVSKIFNAQLWQDQRQHQFRMQHSLEQRAQLKNTDYLAPIIADGDMGFGGIPTIIKMTAAFVEAGVAMFHLDDLAVGLKKWTTGEGRTVVPTCEYLDRLRAARLQLDVMGADTLLLGRCDLDHAEYLTSVVDPRDHKYVFGATKTVVSFQEAMAQSLESGNDMRKAKADWEASAGLMTFDEAVEAQGGTSVNIKYVARLKEDASSAIPLSRRRQLAREAAGFDIVFDWELPRTSLGQYRIRPDVQAIVDRALAAAPLTDVTWARMDFPIMGDIKEFHQSVLKVHPDRLFGFGWGGHYSFSEAAGFPKGSLETLSADLAREYNIVWQVQPVFAIQGINLQIQTFAEIFRAGGIGAYVEHIQKEALARGIDGVESLEWSGGHLSDAYFDAINMKDGHDVKGLKVVNGHQ